MNPSQKVSFDDTAVAFADKSDFELQKMYFLFAAMNNNFLVKTGGGLVEKAFKWKLPVNFLVKPTIFRHFCGGETIAECTPAIAKLAKSNIGTILDYSVEGEGDSKSFDHTMREIIATIEKAAGNKAIPFSVFKITGVLETAVMAKVQAGITLSETEKKAFERGKERVDAICRKAFEKNVRLFIDAEESWIQETIDQLTYEMMATYNKQKALVFNTYQLYRHDRLDVIKRDHENAVKGNYYLGGKLVRGAYMEKERREAQQNKYPDPINPSKKASDDLYNEALKYCVEHIDRIAICAGTHNEASSYLLIDLMAKNNLQPSDERIWFAQLYGMSDNLSYNLANAGYNVAKYVPYGPVEAVMPYLLRRANENTAIAGQSSREFNLIKKEKNRRKMAKK